MLDLLLGGDFPSEQASFKAGFDFDPQTEQQKAAEAATSDRVEGQGKEGGKKQGV